MTSAGRALFLGFVSATIIFLLLPYWRAAAMILRAADAKGAVGRAAQWDARGVTEQVEEISTADGRIRARIFTPSGHARGAVLLVSGVHPDGIDEPRLIDLARDLAGTGVNVVTPEIPDLMQYRLTARVTSTIEHAAEWMADQNRLSESHRIGMIGVSFSGGLSVVAAGRPALKHRVAYVLSFGGHGNLPRVLRYFCTGVEPAPPSGTTTRRPPHDYALAVLLHQAADLMVPEAQVAPLRSGIETFLRASALARIDQRRALEMLGQGRTSDSQLPEPSRTLMTLVNNRDVAALGSRLQPYLDRLGQDPALSPDRSPVPSAAVYLLHGTDDNVIPAVESELLAEHLRGKTRVRTLLSRFLTHVDLSNRPTTLDTWRMIAFWTGALGER